ncbi:MAG: helix-turn-helix domain-containing protein [Synergistaceae bacterium]|nr:helix-turn-helix domain-containing protein [Synergistaceae bacterium]
MNLDEYITITEAAHILEKTVSMIGRLCRAGKLPGAEKKGNAAWLIPRASVESYAPGRRGPRTNKEKVADELAGIRAELADITKEE